MKYRIKNWDEFQQYKDKRPLHWIKLHTKLLKDFMFNQLTELSQLHLVKLWLLAAENHGELEGDASWFARLIGAKKIDLDELVHTGFIVRTDSYETVPREEKRREEESRGEESREEKKDIVPLKRDDSQTVFDFWRNHTGHTKAGFDDKRKAIIRKFLPLYGVDDLCKAIRGCMSTPWNQGDNPQGQIYDALSVIFKDADQIDRFIKNADNPPIGKVKTINQTVNDAQAQADRVKQQMGIQ